MESRDIKLRCILNAPYGKMEDHKECMRLLYNKAVGGFGAELADNYIFMQYTGLKDKNGKEIYEGDITRIQESQRYYIVKFHNGCFKLFHADPKLNDMLWGTIERVSELLWSIEVTGNIYENPELFYGNRKSN